MVHWDVLLVEDDRSLNLAVATVLRRAGLNAEVVATGGDALEALSRGQPDVLVCDYRLPDIDGLEVLAACRQRHPQTEVILVTAFATIDIAIEALRLGASDILTKPIPKLEILETVVRNALERTRLRRELSLSSEALRLANERLGHALAQAQDRYLTTARILAGVLDLYDPNQGSHAKRVAEQAVSLGRDLDLGEDVLRDLEVAATLHDIGYLGLPAARARRDPGLLGAREQAVVQEHPVLGETLLSGLGDGSVSRIVRHHHEAWNGSGYPDGLAGEAIPLESRILAVCETYDEILTWPAPGTTVSAAAAKDTLRRGRGRQFEAEIVDRFLDLLAHRPARPGKGDIEAVALSKLEDGAVLARPIYTIDGLLLLPEGQRLDTDKIERIQRFHAMHPVADRIYVYRRLT